MKNIQNEVMSWVQRGTDQHLCLAVTGLSRSGKTAFITSLVNQLLSVNHGARLPLFTPVREGRVLGVKRILQRDLATPSFTYDHGIAQLYGDPANWPTPTQGVSKIELVIRYRTQHSLLRYIKQTSSLHIEIIDYPGEWLLDLPMLAQDYVEWSEQMRGLLVGRRAEWAASWQSACADLDPNGTANELLLTELAQRWTDFLHRCKAEGYHFIQPGRFVLPGEMAGAPALQFFPWPFEEIPAQQDQRLEKTSTYSVLKQRYDFYCQHIIKKFYKDYFIKFDRQIVLVDCLQPLNSGPDAFNDMRLALTQLMQSFHYGQRSLLRRLFSPVIDKLLFAATKADHVTSDQHTNMVALLRQITQAAWQHAAFEGVNIECLALSAIQATRPGKIEHHQQITPALQGRRLPDYQPVLLYPGEVPAQLPTASFWQQQGFQFENFTPLAMEADKPLPHLRMDNALEFLLGDKLT
ncbi:YcjX family protein [Rosenbergiella australiborealis]|uniref:YcjX family protein n=1 Tax=Rosenbergiella australiborealis TaxID=1544696 RepID=UPI001F4E4BDA|nr:YcjX family protein [Rosenbergiella australiborealis]